MLNIWIYTFIPMEDHSCPLSILVKYEIFFGKAFSALKKKCLETTAPVSSFKLFPEISFIKPKFDHGPLVLKMCQWILWHTQAQTVLYQNLLGFCPTPQPHLPLWFFYSDLKPQDFSFLDFWDFGRVLISLTYTQYLAANYNVPFPSSLKKKKKLVLILQSSV